MHGQQNIKKKKKYWKRFGNDPKGLKYVED